MATSIHPQQLRDHQLREMPQQRDHQLREMPQQRYEGGLRPHQKKSFSTGIILAIFSLLPVGVSGILLGLAGLTLMGSVIGLTIATPLFVICSPVLVPAIIGIGLAVTGFMTSGAFALTGLSTLTWILNSLKQNIMHDEEPLEFAKHKMQDAAMTVGQKTKEVGQTIQSKAGQET